MDLLSQGPIRAEKVIWRHGQGGYTCTVVCKATFDLRPNVSPLSANQDPVLLADVTSAEGGSLSSASDLVPFKKRPEAYVKGHAHAPDGQPVSNLVARMATGEIDKAVQVVGDRYFGLDGRLGDPARFTRMPLVWERAAGGPDTSNPVGVVIGDGAKQDFLGRVQAPNLLPAGLSLASRSDVVAPVSLGPIAPLWPTRAVRLHRHAGSWDPSRWHERPLPDIDLAFFNAAPQDQQRTLPFGEDSLYLENLHPRYPTLSTRFEQVVPVVTLDLGAGPQPVQIRCDTLVIDSDRGVATLVFRAHVQLDHPDRPARILVTMPSPGQASAPTWSQGVSDPRATLAAGLVPVSASLPFAERQPTGGAPVNTPAFGIPRTSPLATSGSFGAPPPPPSTSGLAAPPSGPGTPVFGAPAVAPVFGAPAVSANAPVFGAPPPPAAGPVFGAPPPPAAAPVFGAPPPATAPVFGAPPGPATAPVFGAPPAPAAAPVFGAPPATSNQPVFGAPASPPVEPPKDTQAAPPRRRGPMAQTLTGIEHHIHQQKMAASAPLPFSPSGESSLSSTGSFRPPQVGSPQGESSLSSTGSFRPPQAGSPQGESALSSTGSFRAQQGGPPGESALSSTGSFRAQQGSPPGENALSSTGSFRAQQGSPPGENALSSTGSFRAQAPNQRAMTLAPGSIVATPTGALPFVEAAPPPAMASPFAEPAAPPAMFTPSPFAEPAAPPAMFTPSPFPEPAAPPAMFTPSPFAEAVAPPAMFSPPPFADPAPSPQPFARSSTPEYTPLVPLASPLVPLSPAPSPDASPEPPAPVRTGLLGALALTSSPPGPSAPRAVEPGDTERPPPPEIAVDDSETVSLRQPPFEKFPPERCGIIAARLSCDEPKAKEILGAEELDSALWQEIHTHWLARIREDAAKSKRQPMADYDKAYVSTLESQRGAIALDDYARLAEAAERGAVEGALSERGLPEKSWPHIHRVWIGRMARDPVIGKQVRGAIDALRAAD